MVELLDMETNVTADVETSVEPKTRMYLLSALTKDGQKALAELTELVGQAGSKVAKAEDLGPKKLAFAVNKERELTLVSVFFEANREILVTLDSELKHADTLERYLLTDWKADLNAPARRPRRDEVKKTEAVNV